MRIARLVLLSIVLPACARGPIASPAEYRKEWQYALCEWALRCGELGEGDMAECQSRAEWDRRYPPPVDLDAAVAAGRTRFSGEQARACVEALRAAGCTEDQWQAARASCAPVFTGLQAAGAPCRSGVECQGFCDVPAGSDLGCPGACQDLLVEGSPCDPAAPRCVREAFCEPASRTCRHRLDMGGECGMALRCRLDLVCQGYRPPRDGREEVRGRCAPPGQIGAPCRAFVDGTTDCAPGLYCDPATVPPRCAARLPGGSACAWESACEDGLTCAGLHYDERGNLVRSGQCRRFSDYGMACEQEGTSGCVLSMFCSSQTGTCWPWGFEGAACRQSCGFGLYCDARSGTCLQKRALGSSCIPQTADTEPCFYGVCVGGTCTLRCP